MQAQYLSSSPRLRAPRTIALYGIPSSVDPSQVLQDLQSVGGRLQRAATNRGAPTSSVSLHTHLAAPSFSRSAAYDPLSPMSPTYSIKAEFTSPDAAFRAHDLLPNQPIACVFTSIEHLDNFFLDEHDRLLDLPTNALVSRAEQPPSLARRTAGTLSSAHGTNALALTQHGNVTAGPYPSPFAPADSLQRDRFFSASDPIMPAFTSASNASPLLSSTLRLAHSRHSSFSTHSSSSASVSTGSSPSARSVSFSTSASDFAQPMMDYGKEHAYPSFSDPQSRLAAYPHDDIFQTFEDAGFPVTYPSYSHLNPRTAPINSAFTKPTHIRASSYGGLPAHSNNNNNSLLLRDEYPGAARGFTPSSRWEERSYHSSSTAASSTLSGGSTFTFPLPSTHNRANSLTAPSAVTSPSVAPGSLPKISQRDYRAAALAGAPTTASATVQSAHSRSSSFAGSHSARPSISVSSVSGSPRSVASSFASSRRGSDNPESQKTYSSDPHRGPRSTDWMLSDETLKARESKDAKFAEMVTKGLAQGRTKAGWAQARRPGKRDRDAAKKRLTDLQAMLERGEVPEDPVLIELMERLELRPNKQSITA